MIDITAELLNEIPWFDGIIYIILGLLIYTAKKYIDKKFIFGWFKIFKCKNHQNFFYLKLY